MAAAGLWEQLGKLTVPSLLTVLERVDRSAAVPALTIGAIFGACLAQLAAAEDDGR